jgi:hypothetical protein
MKCGISNIVCRLSKRQKYWPIVKLIFIEDKKTHIDETSLQPPFGHGLRLDSATAGRNSAGLKKLPYNQ